MVCVTQSGLRMVFLAGRGLPGATEAVVYLAGQHEPTLYLKLWGRRERVLIGYAELERAGEEEGPEGVTLGLYELTRLLGADCPCPGPVVSLSGVLWNRREVLEQIEAGDVSLPWQAAPRLPESAFPGALLRPIYSGHSRA